MNYRSIVLIGLLSALIVVAGCGVQPGKSFAGKAIGISCSSDVECDVGELCVRNVCVAEDGEGFEEEDTGQDKGEQENAERREWEVPEGEGFGGSEPEHGEDICGEQPQCDGISVTGWEGKVVCGKDLQQWKCSAKGMWEGTGQPCVCPSKQKCVGGKTCYGASVVGSEGDVICGVDFKKWECMSTGVWKVTAADCKCSAPSTCIDTDKGQNFLIAGKVKYEYDTGIPGIGKVETVVAKDYCKKYTDGSVYLFEGICGDAGFGNDPYYYVEKKCEEGGLVAGLEPAGKFTCKEGKCVVSPCFNAGQAADDFVIPFKDVMFEKAVKQELGIAENKQVMYKDVKDVQDLYLLKKNIQDISGIEYFGKLKKLTLRYNFISDLSPLGCLKELWYLDLYDNDIQDITVLNGLQGVKDLDLGMNKISDITPLKGLIGLEGLDLEGNQISDITALKGLGQLGLLSLRFNQVSDVSSLQDLTKLKILYLDYNKITDVSPLKGLMDLTVLALSFNQISDITSLQGMVKMEYLYLSTNKISDLTALKGMIDLKILSLAYNTVTDISSLKGLLKIEGLQLEGNKIGDVTPLKGSITLEELNLQFNQLKDIASLSGLVNLKYLSISENAQVQDIVPLKGLAKLSHLWMGYTAVSELSPVQNLPLEVLDISSLSVVDLSALKTVSSLERLHMVKLKTGDVKVLHDLHNLEYLNLDEMKVNNVDFPFNSIEQGKCVKKKGVGVTYPVTGGYHILNKAMVQEFIAKCV